MAGKLRKKLLSTVILKPYYRKSTLIGKMGWLCKSPLNIISLLVAFRQATVSKPVFKIKIRNQLTANVKVNLVFKKSVMHFIKTRNKQIENYII